ncbi:NACHT nucleoside triphosphatase [Penicillium robsamsonii]|uniref:NACHT nucleoside triphosphatase n=1 Tax=Penicillium robsamsonii TaxID=1792511 RepID=UPI0025494C3A|nr:NACHT nucleoside triphosphatase [Penicillium robsamsonii]KAJ5826601.1 NACHT nucleoside triphosphatase [Penicillium robsamsonii]
MASHNSARLSGAFQNAKQEFLASLKDPSLFDSVLNVTSMQDVYKFTTQLQEKQSKSNGLRNLGKIKPYLDRLKEYARVIEVFVSAKPEILALIWGPIKLLLQMTENFTKTFDAIVEAIAVIGNKLPLFEAYTVLFEENDRVTDVLVLFYKDILDFYEIVLNFFASKRWGLIFDSVWPRHKDKINVVVSSIEQHCLLMTDQVTLENISGAHRARIEDMKRWQQTFEFQERQDFKSVEDYISPKFYDDELDRLQRTICERTGRWLQREQTLKKWIDTGDKSTRVVWLQGIPGAGKTHISSIIVDKLRGLSRTTLFAFLSYKQGNVSTVSIIHSLIFQMVIGMEHFDQTLKQDLQAKLVAAFQSSRRNLKSNTRFALETLTDLLNCVSPTYIIIDGLDELPESNCRVETLKELLDMLKGSTETRLLISSRASDEIAAVLKTTSKVIRVDDNNSGCIQAYVSVKSEEWLTQSGFDEHACSEIRSLLIPLAKKAKGMFLYARVVIDNIQMCQTFDLVQNELTVLPESLDEAYARVFQRLNDLQPSLKVMSRRALGWIGCSPIPIKIQELSFALSLNLDQDGELPRSQSVINIVRLCGPIVETSDDHVYFVHFTVKE